MMAPHGTRRSGWVSFAAAFMLNAGLLNAIWGVAALSNSTYFVRSGLLVSTLTTWGWIALVLGGLQMLCGVLVFIGKRLGQFLALVLATVGVVVNFLSVGAYPIWSVIALAFNALVLWAVTVHGEEFAEVPRQERVPREG